MSEDAVKHTPGPWEVDFGGSIGHIKSVGQNDYDTTPTVCKYDAASNSCAPSFSAEVMQANAKLIAASPTMLEALVAINEATNPFFEDDPLKLHRARIAVQQAIKLAGHKVV